MSIAEKVTTIAENAQKVYDAGKQAEYDTFWDACQVDGSQKSYVQRFAGAGWNDGTFKPKYDIVVSYNGMVRMFSFSHIQDLRGILEKRGVTLDVSAGANFTNMCESSWITRFPILDISKQNSGYAIFTGCADLQSIQKLIFKADGTTPIGSSMFQNCSALTEIEEIEGTIGQNGFDTHWSTKLSKASIESIVNALSATTTGLTVTFSKTAVNNAFGIDVDDETTWGEGTAFYALRHSKDNWTFSYV